MDTTEGFDQKRLERCIEIHKAIWENWQKTRHLAYTVRATQRLKGLSLDELQKQPFVVGVGEKLEEIPFFDMLMVLSMIEQTGNALDRKSGELNMSYPRSFTDAEAARLLLAFPIETPLD
jgi:hypothetical protein